MREATGPAPANLQDQHQLYLHALRETSVEDLYAAAPYLGADLDVARRETAAILERCMRAVSDWRPRS
jgi:hypothetical protein